MKYVPPLIRRTLLDDSAFNEEFGFKAEAIVSLGTSGVAIQQAGLFNAVRSVLAGAENAEVVDEAGKTWLLKFEGG